MIDAIAKTIQCMDAGEIDRAKWQLRLLLKDLLFYAYSSGELVMRDSVWPPRDLHPLENPPAGDKNDNESPIDAKSKTEPAGPTKFSAKELADSIKEQTKAVAAMAKVDEPAPRRRSPPPTKAATEPAVPSKGISADKVRAVILARAKHAGVDANTIARDMGFKTANYVPGWTLVKKGKVVVTQYADQMIKYLGNQILADQAGQVDKPALGES